MSAAEKLPLRAVKAGTLFDGMVPCYILEDGTRVLSKRGAVRALTGGDGSGAKDGKLDRLVSRLPSRYRHLTVGPNIGITQPQGGMAHAVPTEYFAKVVSAFVGAAARGELRADQRHLGIQAAAIQEALTTLSLDVLVDEACGIQHDPATRAYERRFTQLLRSSPDAWQMRFPPSLVHALAPLWGVHYTGGPYPIELRRPFALIYDIVLGANGASAMRRQNNASGRVRHHQWLSEPVQAQLVSDLRIVEAFAGESRSRTDLWNKMRKFFNNVPYQTDMW